MELDAQTLASGGGIMIGAYAVVMFGRLVSSITGFLDKLDRLWKDETEHRAAEAKHWSELLAALKTKARARK